MVLFNRQTKQPKKESILFYENYTTESKKNAPPIFYASNRPMVQKARAAMYLAALVVHFQDKYKNLTVNLTEQSRPAPALKL